MCGARRGGVDDITVIITVTTIITIIINIITVIIITVIIITVIIIININIIIITIITNIIITNIIIKESKEDKEDTHPLILLLNHPTPHTLASPRHALPADQVDAGLPAGGVLRAH